MHALLLATAFAMTPQPQAIEVTHSPDGLNDLIRIHSWEPPETRPKGEWPIVVPWSQRIARYGPILSLEVIHNEGGFKSGFGLLPPGALPMTSAGFWPSQLGFGGRQLGGGGGAFSGSGGFGRGMGGFAPGGSRGMGGSGGR